MVWYPVRPVAGEGVSTPVRPVPRRVFPSQTCTLRGVTPNRIGGTPTNGKGTPLSVTQEDFVGDIKAYQLCYQFSTQQKLVFHLVFS